MNTLKLVWEPKGILTVARPSCDIVIDGESISEIINQLLGDNRYGPIQHPMDPKHYFYGHKNSDDEVRNKKAIAECNCGYGCGSVVACKIIWDEDKVIWRNLSTVRGEDLSALDGFVFDEAAYFDELQAYIQSA